MEQKLKAQRFKLFGSFHEAQAYEDKFAADQDPIDRMAATLKTIKAVYNYKPRPKGMKRTFELRKLY